MHKRVKESMVLLLTTALILSPIARPSLGYDTILEEPVTAESMIIDLILARPLGLVVTAGGMVLFIMSLPFSALGKNTEAAYEKLIKKPATFTFERPLGDFRGWDR